MGVDLQVVAWRCNRLDDAGNLVMTTLQNYPWPVVPRWYYYDDPKIAAELRGEGGLKACPSHINWQPLYGEIK